MAQEPKAVGSGRFERRDGEASHEMLDGYDTTKRLASSADHIAPGHDPLVLQRYPAQPGGPADIVRLDAEPLK